MDKRRKKEIAQQREILHKTIEKSETLHEGNVLKESHVLDEFIMAYYKDNPETSENSQEENAEHTDLKKSTSLPAGLIEKD